MEVPGRLEADDDILTIAVQHGGQPVIVLAVVEDDQSPSTGLAGGVDQHLGPDFVSKDLDRWAWSNGVKLDFSRPGKPTDNAFIESFNASFRAGTKCARSHSA